VIQPQQIDDHLHRAFESDTFRGIKKACKKLKYFDNYYAGIGHLDKVL